MSKFKKTVSYFPVDSTEQEILYRIRESDLAGRLPELVGILDLLAEADVSAADLEQALRLLQESRQGEGLDARFENLEARLTARIEKGLAEIEGRLSRRFGGDSAEPAAPEAPKRTPTPPSKEVVGPPPPPPALDVPKGANLAFRVDQSVVWGESAAQFYVAVWRWLFEHGRVGFGDLPIGTEGKKRFDVAATPVHPSGKEFYRAEQPVPGVYVEVNLSRGDIVRKAKKYLTSYGVPFEVIVGSAE